MVQGKRTCLILVDLCRLTNDISRLRYLPTFKLKCILSDTLVCWFIKRTALVLGVSVCNQLTGVWWHSILWQECANNQAIHFMPVYKRDRGRRQPSFRASFHGPDTPHSLLKTPPLPVVPSWWISFIMWAFKGHSRSELQQLVRGLQL